ncbi:MAG: c-type cytochrome [Myxococcota bacterium]|nr:c-type cytochrome [Myxococcota bacterium]
MNRLVLAACVAALTWGCADKPAAAPAPLPPASAPQAAPAAAASSGTITDADRKLAAETFATRCTPCHGPSGKGDGPASAGLTPKPRNLGDAEWQKSVTDTHIEQVISYGGAAVGKSPAMPPNPDLADKPVIKALREHIRQLQGK